MARVMLDQLATVETLSKGVRFVEQAVRTLEKLEAKPQEARVTTLLDLVAAVAESAKTEAEVVATVTHLINSGQIRLIGNFQGADVRVS